MKLCILFAIYCLIQTSYSSYLYDSSDSGEDESDFVGDEIIIAIGSSNPLKPRNLKLRKCAPGFCCPIELECRGLFCHDPASGRKEHSVLVCDE